MRKWIALILVALALVGTAKAVADNGETKIVDSCINGECYPYYRNWDYPNTLLFKGVAMTKDKDTYPAILLVTGENDDFWDSDAKIYFILDGKIHEMEIDDVEKTDKDALIVELKGDGELTLLVRYERYMSHVSISGIYNKKYLLNLDPASNDPVYRILEDISEPLPVPAGNNGVPEDVEKPESEEEDIWS